MSSTPNNNSSTPAYLEGQSILPIQDYPQKDESATNNSKDIKGGNQKTLEQTLGGQQQTKNVHDTQYPTFDYGGCFATPFHGPNSLAEVKNLPLLESRTITLRSGHGQVSLCTFQPGWKYKEHMAQIVKTDSCQHQHFGFCLKGALKVTMDDGTSRIFKKDDAIWCPPGHAAEVVGDEPCTVIDSAGFKFAGHQEHPLKGNQLIFKSFNQPDEVREIPKGKLHIIKFPSGIAMGKIIVQPGWKWSEHLKPVMKTDLCPMAHMGVVLRGAETIVQRSGASITLNATRDGPVLFECDPGHDAWVEGNEEVEAYDLAVLEAVAKPVLEQQSQSSSSSQTTKQYPEAGYGGCFSTPFDGENSLAEVRKLPKAEVRLVQLRSGKGSLGLIKFQPGWSWRECIQPLVKTDWCMQQHYGVVLQGEMFVRMKDGTERNFKVGDAFYIPPGHDGHVVGNQEAIMIDAQGMKTYGTEEGCHCEENAADQLHLQPLTIKSFNNPDDYKEINNAKLYMINFGPTACIGKLVASPGWKWSNDIKPIVKTEWCEHTHIGVFLSGRQEMVQKNGQRLFVDARNGPVAFELSPGHDAWVVGNDVVEAFDITIRRDTTRPKMPGGDKQ